MNDAAQVEAPSEPEEAPRPPEAVPPPLAAQPSQPVKPQVLPLATFLESSTVLAHATVAIECEYIGARYDLLVPDVQLFCNSPLCGRVNAFAPDVPRWTVPDRSTWTELKFLRYTCRECQKSPKLYAVRIRFGNESLTEAAFTKIGEEPPNIGPTPRALRDLLGDAWVLYLKGVRSELAGLELGAFVYYRRAVERIWPALLDKFTKLSQYDASLDQLRQLHDAKEQKQINRSMEGAKESIPAALFVDGKNPLEALIEAYGDRAKEYPSAECAIRADGIRRALNQLARVAAR
jgi:hypothetical protein